ncbi:MAG: hypothetical protein V9G19_09005 [Tetrasphaera sp.]
MSYTWPNPALGFDWPQWSGVVDGMRTTVTPQAKAAGWGYLNGPVTLDDGDPNVDESYGYLAPALPAEQLQPGQSFTPLLTAPIPGSDAHFKVLGHGVVSWLTRGVSGGIYRNWFSIHTDDVFLPDDRWSIEGHCTRGADCDPDDYPSDITSWIRMKPADVTNLVAWQRRSARANIRCASSTTPGPTRISGASRTGPPTRGGARRHRAVGRSGSPPTSSRSRSSRT